MELESTLHESAGDPPQRPSSLRPLAVAPTIEGYAIEGAIGAGATGTVFRALQQAVDRPVALKILHSEHSGNPRIVRRLVREARTLARLKHPGIVGAIDMGQHEGRWWFAMELVEGQTLAERLRASGPLSEREALRLFLPLAEAVEHLWEHGVVHRDIKPANILLDGAPADSGRLGRPRLADLGLAFAEFDPSITGEGSLLGTPHYVSPEQAKDPTSVDVRSDIWALGATLFHSITGRPPFRGQSVAEVLSQVLHARIPDPQELAPGISNGFALVLRKCLVRSPEGRYQTPRELIADLELLRERRAPKVRSAELDPLAHSGRPWFSAKGVLVVLASLSIGALFAGLWLDPPGKQAAVPATDPGNQRFEPIDNLLARVRSDPAQLAAAFADLDGLRSSVPSDSGSRWWSAREELETHLRNQVADLRQKEQQAFDAALSDGDFEAARLQLTDGFEGDLRATTGFAPQSLPIARQRELEGFLADLAARLDSGLARAGEAAAAAALRRFEALVLPEAEALWAAGRWSSALDRLELSTTGLLTEAGLDPARLPEATRAAALVEPNSRAKRRWNLWFSQWLEGQERLLQAGDRALAQALAEQRWDSRVEALEAALEAAYAAAVQQLGVLPKELPKQGQLRLEQAREEWRRELVNRFAVRALDLARGAAEVRLSVLAPAWLQARLPQRALAHVVAASHRLELLTVDLEDRSAALGLDLTSALGGLRELGQRLEIALLELNATDRLMAAAARGVLEEVGRRGEWVVPFGNGGVPLIGTISAGADPRRDGFQLRVDPGRVYALSLERLDPTDLLRLSRGGASGRLAAVEVEQAGGLLLLREGRRAEAAAALASLRSEAAAPLCDLLSKRLLDGLGSVPVDAARVFEQLGSRDTPEALEARDPEGARDLIGLLLERFSGDPRVGLERLALESRLAAIERTE